MFQEDLGEERFYVNRGRDEFVDRLLNISVFIPKNAKREISELFDD